MQLFFVDESGSPPPPNKITTEHFVVGGVIISEDQWFNVEKELNYLKGNFSVKGEIKWRHFGQKIGMESDSNNLKHLDRNQRDLLRESIFHIIRKYHSIKVIATIASTKKAYEKKFVKSQDDLYWRAYKPLTERFQYYLQDLSRNLGSKINGIIVCDHRERQHDENLRMLHTKLLNNEAKSASKYNNLVEGLFLTPSHLSIGIQLADMTVGAIFRKFEHQDDRWFKLLHSSWRRSAEGTIEGYGLVKIPKE